MPPQFSLLGKMPFIYKKPEIRRLAISSSNGDFMLLLQEIPSSVLFELAQTFQRTRQAAECESDRITIPVEFVRLVLDAVVETARGWEGVCEADGRTLEFSTQRLREILDGDVNIIPQLVAHVADLFQRSQSEQNLLEDEEKN